MSEQVPENPSEQLAALMQAYQAWTDSLQHQLTQSCTVSDLQRLNQQAQAYTSQFRQFSLMGLAGAERFALASQRLALTLLRLLGQ